MARTEGRSSGSSLTIITLGGCHGNAGGFQNLRVSVASQWAVSDAGGHTDLLTLAKLGLRVTPGPVQKQGGGSPE